MSEALPHASTVSQSPSPLAPDKASSPQAARARPGSVDSTELLRGHKTLDICHNGSTYRLQATRLGKLILTK
ncbi:MAG: hemin uptake protein HemP [Polaromonas sp.]